VIQSTGSTYFVRKDIEGLRAIAVLAVVLNHIQPSALQGGFVGVDIFFVISGYLIGMHLLQDIQEGRFSFLRFYGRRARRLLPALVVTLITVWAVGWIILSGPEFSDLGKHIAAAAFFSNNILLWLQTGYFEAPATGKPLLHLWSLGVEEQFYLAVPFLLWLGSVGRRASIRWVLRCSGVSLLLTAIYPAASFYLLDTRFWELGAGVAIGYLTLHGASLSGGKQSLVNARYRELVAFAVLLMLATILVYTTRHPSGNELSLWANIALIILFALAIASAQLASTYRESNLWNRLVTGCRRHGFRVREAASVLGTVLIGISLIAITPVDWPGPQTLFPVLGTALVIMAGPASSMNKLVSSRALVFVGGISYPLYLWHWPALAFWRMCDFDRSVVGSLIPVLTAFILAWLTKVLVEDPARFGKMGSWVVPVPRIRVLLVGLLIGGLVGVSTVAMQGFPKRTPPNLRVIADLDVVPEGEDWRTDRCFFDSGANADFAPECTPAKRPGTPTILLWGDSHAAHLYPGLLGLQVKNDFVLVQWTAGGCPPVRISLVGERAFCAERRSRALEEMNRVAPDTVLLAASWKMYLDKGTPEAKILAANEDVIRWLQQIGVRRIVLIGPAPSWVTTEAADVFRYMLRKGVKDIPERLGAVSDEVRHLDAAMTALAAARHVEYVSILSRFCDASGCLVQSDRNLAGPDLLFRDQDHLTKSGSRLLMEGAATEVLGPH
jgi:peptidoglycan/LPS O-acetylase OafA/YrhL